MNPCIYLNNIPVGKDYPPVIIAEIGINHNGSLIEAKKLVDSAYNVGCKIIKHQTHIIDEEMSSSAKYAIPGNSPSSIYDIMARCALNEKDEFELMEYVQNKGMLFLSTPFSKAAVDRLEKFGVTAYKIGSGECNNHPLLEYIASLRKTIILSTGMNSLSDIKESVAILEKYNTQYALLHCTNLYPTPAKHIRLGAMQELEKEFPKAVIGLSDHSINNNASLAAVALGASIIERHYTDTKDRIGEDIVCSMDEKELSTLLQGVQEIYEMRGGKKDLLKEEEITRSFAFATVVATRNIVEGEVFTKENIWVKRPGCGEIPAKEYNTLLGKKSSITIEKDTHIKKDMIQK